MRLLALSLLPAALLFSSPSFAADDAPPRRFELGARLGYSLPFGLLRAADAGSAADDVALPDVLSGQLPLTLEIGYWLTPELLAAVYGQYGFVFLETHPSGCPEGFDCSAADLRFGLELQYHVGRERDWDPWFGLGVGYEILRGNGDAGGFESTETYSGWEYLGLQAGVDFAAGSSAHLGPFVGLSLGRYTTASYDTPFGQSDEDVDGFHQWLQLGVRASLDW